MSNWYQKIKDLSKPIQRVTRSAGKDNGLIRCAKCGKKISRKEAEINLFICHCGNHFHLSTINYLKLLFDEGKFELLFENITTHTQVDFTDRLSYDARVAEATSVSSTTEAVVVSSGLLGGHKVLIVCLNFDFIAGSIGSVVGEKIARAADMCVANNYPLVLISKSGGARLMEGTSSLYQMPKITASLGKLDKEGIPFISLITDPSIGWAVSIAMLADVILAEPDALIGFTSPKVVKESTGRDLKKGFQRSEFLFKNGFIDAVIPRKELKLKLVSLVTYLC